ncbi:hypothetical protein PYW07_016104 [Mythimna separata]|uniref:Uncharacterized protein n=1 Tax=Mythimna separata TaxID=271217 RepID=A0AAD7YSP6_MYTSE|nr:hypothetical protein PYW07_016104 [Mythimna separata]
MAVAPIFPVLLLAVVTRCRCDHGNGFNKHGGNSASQFGTLLKPPPPPLPPVPVPFHKGPERSQRQNSDIGYQYQSPPPPPKFNFPTTFFFLWNSLPIIRSSFFILWDSFVVIWDSVVIIWNSCFLVWHSVSIIWNSFPWASEDHISATKSVPDASFESTGGDVGNELYDNSMPADLKSVTRVPNNHKFNFADLRGVNDDDVDKYRTESNLQNIDSPLLYLKPNTPHKNHGNFILAISSPVPENEYEIYDDIPTTVAPQIPTITTSWDENKNEYNGGPHVQKNTYKPKIVQIIVPYTTGKKQADTNEDFVQMSQDWPSTPKDEYQARKVPSNTESSYVSPITENYNTVTTTTEDTQVMENYDSDRSKDFYDVKEPPFDIIKLQHTIDDWTEQEYSKQYQTPQRTHSNEKHAKQIPDDYFTTTMPANYVTTTSNYNYEFYDHEGSSSVQNVVTDDSNNTFSRPRKEYNIIERTKNRHNSGKNEELDEVQKLHIYTAASSFRTTSTSTTTTPAPWGKIQTSISPLTKEKVYVVTSKPWRDMRNVSTEWYEVESFESKKTSADSEYSASSNLPFKSPRFMNRPSFGFTSGGKIESDSSYGFSKSWYQSINELETQKENNSTSLAEDSQQRVTTNLDEDNTTASPHNG